MKNLKYIFIGIVAMISLFIMFGFARFATLPSPPIELVKIADSNWNLDSEFHKIKKEFWQKENDKLVFNNTSDQKEKALLYSELIPSEHKKDGYITTSVTIPANFNELADDCIFGFQLGEKNAEPDEQLLLGLNGNGELTVSDGELNPLTAEKITASNRFSIDCCEEVKLAFHYYKNPTGWVLFLRAKAGEEQIGTVINHIPYEKLNAANKELSLFAYNPSQKSKIWFKDWKIQNDWTPND